MEPNPRGSATPGEAPAHDPAADARAASSASCAPPPGTPELDVTPLDHASLSAGTPAVGRCSRITAEAPGTTRQGRRLVAHAGHPSRPGPPRRGVGRTAQPRPTAPAEMGSRGPPSWPAQSTRASLTAKRDRLRRRCVSGHRAHEQPTDQSIDCGGGGRERGARPLWPGTGGWPGSRLLESALAAAAEPAARAGATPPVRPVGAVALVYFRTRWCLSWQWSHCGLLPSRAGFMAWPPPGWLPGVPSRRCNLAVWAPSALGLLAHSASSHCLPPLRRAPRSVLTLRGHPPSLNPAVVAVAGRLCRQPTLTRHAGRAGARGLKSACDTCWAIANGPSRPRQGRQDRAVQGAAAACGCASRLRPGEALGCERARTGCRPASRPTHVPPPAPSTLPAQRGPSAGRD